MTDPGLVTLPCLSLRQPWAWAVLHGKDIENRRWNTNHRGAFLIHAAKGMMRYEYVEAFKFCALRGMALPPFEGVDRGGIVGAASLDAVVKPLKPIERPAIWHMREQYGFKLSNVVALDFRPYKGALGFFRVELTPGEVVKLRECGLLKANADG